MRCIVMHYYSFNPKNYMSKTSFLEPMEDLAYRRMLDHCYLTEQPLPKDIEEIAMLIRMRSHCDSIKIVLRYFFELTDDGYVNDTVNKVISEYHGKSKKAKASADARWEKEREKRANALNCDANALRMECEGNANNKQLTINNEQGTIKEDIPSDKPKKSNPKKTGLPSDFEISGRVRDWAYRENHQNLELHLERFKELAIMKAYKYADWDLAFMKAVREDWGKVNNQYRQNPVYQTAAQRTASEQEMWRNACLGNDEQNEIDVTPQGRFLNG